MIKISREWATPLTIGVFALMSVTGLLMFFHLDSALQKTVHEWAGWVVVSAAALHVSANWLGFKRYFKPGIGAAVIALCALLIGASFIPLGGAAGASQSPPAIAMRALSQAPLSSVAPLFGKSVPQARQALAAADIVLPDDQASLASVIGADRERLGQALRALAQP
ncbi:MAG: DUF4405 domain-containing protein [Burkholderiaceae bacterium]|nr:DUF4405 domain-containing protein [Burkholderiaceae bacterium]